MKSCFQFWDSLQHIHEEHWNRIFLLESEKLKSELRARRVVQAYRINMIETVLESFNIGNQENIYIAGLISNRFCSNEVNVIVS